MIIRDILLKGKCTYSEFVVSDEKIASNILVARLKHLTPIILEIVLWSSEHDTRPFARRDVLEKIRQDRQEFEARLRAAPV